MDAQCQCNQCIQLGAAIAEARAGLEANRKADLPAWEAWAKTWTGNPYNWPCDFCQRGKTMWHWVANGDCFRCDGKGYRRSAHRRDEGYDAPPSPVTDQEALNKVQGNSPRNGGAYSLAARLPCDGPTKPKVLFVRGTLASPEPFALCRPCYEVCHAEVNANPEFSIADPA